MVKRKARRLKWSKRTRLLASPLIAVLLVMVIFGVAVIFRSSATVEPNGPSGNWDIVFDDEFDGTSLNSTSWANSWFGGGSMNNVKTSASNVAVSGGNLILTLSSSSTGALVDTDPSQAKTGFQFGTGYYAEARVFFPGSGKTIDNWPAWWTDGQPTWPKNGEIDIAEGLGGLSSNYHSPSGANNSGTIAGTWADGWHTYGVDREAGKNTIWWDGKVVRTYNTNDGGAPHFLIFNVGDGEGPTVTGANGQLKVDYVRVWKYAGTGTPTPTPTPTPTHTPTPTPPPTPTPTPTHTPTPVPGSPSPTSTPGGGNGDGGSSGSGGGLNAGGGNSGASGSVVSVPGTDTTATVIQVPPSGSDNSTTSAPKSPQVVSGVVTLPLPDGATGASVAVDGAFAANGRFVDTTYLANGLHTLTLSYALDGQSTQTSVKVNVQNKLNEWQRVRNELFLPMHGNKTAINVTLWLIALLVVAGIGFWAYRWRQTFLRNGGGFKW